MKHIVRFILLVGFLASGVTTLQASWSTRLDLQYPAWTDTVNLGTFNPQTDYWYYNSNAPEFYGTDTGLVYRADWNAEVLSSYTIWGDCINTPCYITRELYGGGTFDLQQWNDVSQTWTPLYLGTIGGGYFRIDCFSGDCHFTARLATSGVWLDTGELGSVVYSTCCNLDGPLSSRLVGMTGTPEPSTLMLVGSGALGLWIQRKRLLRR